MSFRSGPAALCWAVLIALGVAQLQAAPFSIALSDDPAELAASIFGPGVSVVGTPVLSSQPGQSGLFTNFSSGMFTQSSGAAGMYNLPAGIILTTGIASGAEGSYTGGPSYEAFGSGDPMLSALSGGPTFDANILSFQFTSLNPTLSLNFVYASAEYPSSVGSTFGDPFAIVLNGVNLALVPGTATPVSINSINAVNNSNYFTQYSTPGTPFNYGGATTVLNATANVSTSGINTITFAIADGGDGSLDSALLIQGISPTPVPEPSTALLCAAAFGLFCAGSAARRKAAVRRTYRSV